MAWYDEAIAEVEAAFRRQQLPVDSPWLADEVVFDWSRSIGDNRGIHEGRDSVRTIFERFLEAWDEVDWRVESVEEIDAETLLVTTRVVGRGRDSGAEVEASGAQIWEFRDRTLVRATMFQSREDAAREAGLSA